MIMVSVWIDSSTPNTIQLYEEMEYDAQKRLGGSEKCRRDLNQTAG